MKESELRAAAKCAVCHNKIGASRVPMFWRLRIERHMLNLGALERQQGLGMMLGHGGLAMAMGPDEDMTEPLLGPIEVTVCEDCALKPLNIHHIVEAHDDGDETS